MGFYNRHILPKCLDMACGVKPIFKQREKIIPRAHGKVVEIGMGSCLNLPHYNPENVSEVIGVEPDPHVWARGETTRKASPIAVTQIGLSGEALPLDDKIADTVVVTYALCTIPDPVAALKEMRRVLKPDGEILFCEHGMAPEPGVQKWQGRIDKVWKHIAGGCHSGRDIPGLIKAAGLSIQDLDEMYIPGPKVLSYNYWGSAR